jgi:hypothetical protein
MLRLHKYAPARISTVSDGTSNTIAIVEDVGKGSFVSTLATPGVSPVYAPHRLYAWIDGDSANGVSGPSGGTIRGINNNSLPRGGPSTCPWTTNNCGPNDEPFGFHDGGILAVFGDGHVGFLAETLPMVSLARLCNPNDGYPTPDY